MHLIKIYSILIQYTEDTINQTKVQDHAFLAILMMFGRWTLFNSLVDFLLWSVYESHIGTYFLKVSKNLSHRLWKKKMLSIGVVPSRGTVIHCSLCDSTLAFFLQTSFNLSSFNLFSFLSLSLSSHNQSFS